MFALAVGNCNAIGKAEIQIDKKTSLLLRLDASKAIAKMTIPQLSSLQIDPALRRSLVSSNEFFSVAQKAFLVHGRSYFFIVTQTSSNHSGSGYCGAGTEDHLRLIELDKKQKRLIQKDSLLIQSCLKSISLQDDQATPLSKLLEARIDASQNLTLSWLNHPLYGEKSKTIFIENGKLRIH